MKLQLLLSYLFKGVLFSLLILFVNIFPQWSDDPSQNLEIADLNGDQTLSKISNIEGGGCYISWFDNRNGNYSVYMQRLNPQGEKQWGTDGLLISGNPQNSSLVDYDLMTDADGNAVVTFTDVRTGNMNVFAYKISPAGDFLWGTNGINLSTSTDFQANPKVTQTTNGNYVFAWVIAPSVQSTALQKVDADGNIIWNSDPIIYNIDAEENISYPEVVPTIEDGVILTYTAYTGPFFSASAKLFAQKFDSSGTITWGNDGIPVQNQGGISGFHVPQTISDGNNGAYIAWHDDRNSDQLASAFVQHFDSDGNFAFPTDGAEGSLMAGRNNFNPRVGYDQSTGEVFLFWIETNNLQSQFGIYGQRFSSDGSRLWTDNGKMFLALGDNGLSSLNVQFGDNNSYVFFLEITSGVNTLVEGFSTDPDGNMNWGGLVTLSDAAGEKLQMVSTIDQFNVSKLAWGDRRNDGGGIYAQNINSDGTLGYEPVPVELTSFSAIIVDKKVELRWATTTETNNSGFEIYRKKSEVRSQNSEWNTIGFIEGSGTTTEEQNYSYVDEKVETGNYSYRLKQIDYDGSYEYSDIIEVEIGIPDEFSLEQNYPNPFNPSTKINYSLAVDSKVQLDVYNIIGQKVATLINADLTAGNYSINFDAERLTSGIYIYKLNATGIDGRNFSSVKKMILMR